MHSSSPRPTIDQRSMALGFLACVLRAAGQADRVDAPEKAPVRPAKVIKQGSDYVAFSGCAPHQHSAIESLLGEWLGAPKITENRMGDYLIGRRAEFSGGVSLVYMAERDNGITLTISPCALPSLVSKLQAEAAQAVAPRIPTR